MAVKFNRRVDKVPAAKAKVLKAAKASFTPRWPALNGRWLNCDAKTRGVEAIVISGRRKFNVAAWGSCRPKWCKWGLAKPAWPYSESVSSSKAVAFTAEWRKGWARTLMTGTFCGGCLKVETYTHFTDGSKRYDYYSSDCFFKADRTTWLRRVKGKI